MFSLQNLFKTPSGKREVSNFQWKLLGKRHLNSQGQTKSVLTQVEGMV